MGTCRVAPYVRARGGRVSGFDIVDYGVVGRIVEVYLNPALCPERPCRFRLGRRHVNPVLLADTLIGELNRVESVVARLVLNCSRRWPRLEATFHGPGGRVRLVAECPAITVIDGYYPVLQAPEGSLGTVERWAMLLTGRRPKIVETLEGPGGLTLLLDMDTYERLERACAVGENRRLPPCRWLRPPRWLPRGLQVWAVGGAGGCSVSCEPPGSMGDQL